MNVTRRFRNGVLVEQIVNGSVTQKSAPKQKYLIPRDCLDAKGNLKPESECAKKMRAAREAKQP